MHSCYQGGALAALCVLCVGCDDGPVIELRQWSVLFDGGPAASVQLPVHLPRVGPDGKRLPHFRLKHTAKLPPAWRGQPLTLAVVRLPAIAKLRVNGVEAQQLEEAGGDRYRGGPYHRWRITPKQSKRGTLDLELTLANTWAQSGWLDAVPRLSPTEGGGPAFHRIYNWNRITAALGLASTLLAAVIFFAIFLANRARSDSGWFALHVLCGGVYPAWNLDLLQPVLGSLDVPVAGLAVSLAGLAGIHMTHALFKLGPPLRIWLFGWLGHLLAAIVFRSPFQATFVAGFCGGGFIAVAAVYMMVRYALLWRRQRLGAALTLSVGWGALVALAGLDISAWIGLGGLVGGWQGAGAGILMIVLAQAVNLSREHSQALAKAETLTDQLAAQLKALEESHREKERLNEELRHQVGIRSEQLAEILARHTAGEAPTAALEVGDVINDRYRIESVIGSGGMGTVYRAVRLSDGRACAFKVIKHRPSQEHLARLSREAMVLAQIRHPNIVEVLDINVSQSGRLYIVMELLEGTPLEAKRERFGDVAWGLPILAQMASALETIHARRVVHRDLKPANILLLGADDGGREKVKVVDFGLAGLVEGGASSVIQLATTMEALTTTKPPKSPSLTQTGAILGTPLYMAPEYVSGTKEIGPPADVFSFGVVAYEMLSGILPFAKLPIVEALHRHAVEPQQPLAEICHGIDAGLAALLTRCVESDPARRPLAGEIARALFAEPNGSDSS